MRFIFAADKHSYGIGYQNRLAWHIPEDLQFLRETIGNSPIIAGTKTYLSLPPSLKERTRVLSGQSQKTSWDTYLQENHQDWWVLGGASVYRSLLENPVLSHVAGGIIVWVDFKGTSPAYDCYMADFCQNMTKVFRQTYLKLLADTEAYRVEAAYFERK